MENVLKSMSSMEQPHEIEAYGAEDELFVNFMYDTYGEWLGDQ